LTSEENKIQKPSLKDMKRYITSFERRLLDNFWGKLISNVIRELSEAEAGVMAASIAYYALFSIFPLMLGIFAILGLFLPSEALQNQLILFLQRNLPASVDIFKGNVSSIIELRGVMGVLSLIGLFWSGSAIFDAIGRVIRRAWNIQKRRPYYLRKMIDLILALCTCSVFILSMGLLTILPLWPEMEIFNGIFSSIFISKFLPFIIVFISFLLIFKYIPYTIIRWRDIWPGALLSAVLFEILRNLFSFYLIRFAHYQMIYGSLASIIMLIFWMYLSAFIFIIGAEFCSEYTKLRTGSDITGN
jgi:membrane protein